MITITRKLEFDSGHRVLGHEGKCKNLHGHHYVAEITIRAPDLDGIGRVIDFGEVKRLVGSWIDKFWDHNMLLHPDDPQLQHLIKTEPIAPYIMKRGNPTAENMAAELGEIAILLLPPIMQIVQVRIYETPNCWADWENS